MSKNKKVSAEKTAENKSEVSKKENKTIDFIVDTDETDNLKKNKKHKSKNKNTESKPKAEITKSHKISRIVILSFVGVTFVTLVLSIYFALIQNKPEGVSLPEIITETFAPLKKEFTFPDNISVNGVNLAGMTEEEAITAVTETQNSILRKFTYKISANGKTASVNQDSFAYIFNTEDIIADAKAFAEENKTLTEVKDFPIAYVIDSDKINSTLNEAANRLDTPAVNPTVTGVSGNKLQFAEGKSGVVVNRTALYKAFEEFYKSENEYGEISLATEIDTPDYTISELASKLTLVSQYTTVSTNTANANVNMKLAMQACDGSVIQPGEVWSFNKCTGNSNLKSNGYLPATVIVGGKLDDGIGGGICQASTTIYDAALFAGLEIEERHCHYWVSKYANPGFDATIDYPRLDLKIKNNTNYPVYISCEMTGTKLVARIFGVPQTNYDKITLTDSLAKKSGEYFYVNSYRNFYRNGVLINSEYLGQSKYSGTYKGDIFSMYNEATDSPPEKPKPEPEVSSSEISSSSEDTSQSETSSGEVSSDTSSGQASEGESQSETQQSETSSDGENESGTTHEH